MEKLLLTITMMLAFSPLWSQASTTVADSGAASIKDLSGMNYYDFYIDYYNSTFGAYQVYNNQHGAEDWSNLGWSIKDMQDLQSRFGFPENNARNCFYDWCLKYVDKDKDSVLNYDELAAVRVIHNSADPEHLLGRNAVDYHFDWFPNLERLELSHPNWRYLIGDKNEALALSRDMIPDGNYTTSVYLNDVKPFSHLYLPTTGKLESVVIKNSPMLFFNYEPQEGVAVPKFVIEGEVMGNESGYTFSLNKYVAAGLDVNRIVSIDNAKVVVKDDGDTYLQFNNSASEANMKYLIAVDGDKQYTCNSTIKIQAQTGWINHGSQAIKEGESVAIDQEHFTDPNFRSYLSTHVDTNEDGVLSYEELGNVHLLRTYNSSWNYYNFYDTDDFDGEDLLKKVINFKGIEYLYNLEGVSFGHCSWGIDDDTNIFHFRNLDLSRNINLKYFYLGTDAEVIDLKLPETNGLELSNPLMRMGFDYQTSNPAVRLVELDGNNAYSLDEDIANGLDLNRLTVLEGGHLEGNKVVFDDGASYVDLQYVARPPIMGGAQYIFGRYLQNYNVLYNLVNTRLYDSQRFDAQKIMEQLTGINTVDANKEAVSVLYYNLQGIESSTTFNGFNIKVTTYSDGTRSAEKIIR